MDRHETLLLLNETAERTSDGCLLVTIGSNNRGYRTVWLDGKNTYVHRLVMSDVIGRPLLPGRVETVDHECHNRDTTCDAGEDCPHRRCIEPTHLALADQTENWRKGRLGVVAKRRALTHCPANHPYDETNTYIWNGVRACRTCHRERERVRREAK